MINSEKILIIGAGLTGSVIGNILANNNERVLVIDRKEHIAGSIYDYKDIETGINVHKYGPHIFHTNMKEVWDFLSKFTKWHPFSLMPNVVINGKPVTLPFNLTTIHEIFDEDFANKLENALIEEYGFGSKISILEFKNNSKEEIKFISDFVYENVFKNYTIKQWGLKPEEINPEVTARVPVIVSYDNRYFHDKYQGIPQMGYTSMIENMLNHSNIELRLNTDYKNLSYRDYKSVICTGSIDEYFDYKFGILPYRSLRFDIQTINKEFFQKTVVTNYPNDNDYTRITEHKYFLNDKSEKTIISYEYPEQFENGKNERYYPIENENNSNLYKKYAQEAEKIQNLYFVGRLGNYKYYNMDLAVKRAMDFAENYLTKNL